MSQILPNVKQDLLAYLHGETTPNSLFHYSETILSEALLHLLAENGISTNFQNLVSEFLEVSLWFAQATDGIMGAIIDNNKNDLRKSDPEEIELSDLSKLTDIYIPWFTETET